MYDWIWRYYGKEEEIASVNFFPVYNKYSMNYFKETYPLQYTYDQLNPFMNTFADKTTPHPPHKPEK